MKKYISSLLLILLSLTVFLAGCDEKNSNTGYDINKTDTIKIGALLPLSGDYVDIGQKVSDGIMYAYELAQTIKLDRKYKLELIIRNSESLSQSVSDMKNNKVAAVICVGGNKEKTDDIIASFEGCDVPLVFVDNYSSSIKKNERCFTLGTAYSYQMSSVCADALSLGFSRGAVICCDEEYIDAADIFESSFVKSGTVTKYYKSGDDANYSAKSIASGIYDFTLIIGNTSQCRAVAAELKECGDSSTVYMTEVLDKTMLENSGLNDIRFISKLEFDDDNYIGSVFMNSYSEAKSMTASKVTSAEAYGYDSYMLVYEALHSLTGDSVPPIFSATAATAAAEGEYDTTITTSDVRNAIKSNEYCGATNTVKFIDDGTVKTNFLYIDKLEGKNSVMQNKYSFNN